MPTCYRPRRKALKHRSTQSRIQDMEWDPKFNFSFLQHHFTADVRYLHIGLESDNNFLFKLITCLFGLNYQNTVQI